MHTKLSDRIRALRRRRRLSQAELAKELGVSPSAVGHWERGDGATPSAENLFALAALTGIDPLWIAIGEGGVGPSGMPARAAPPVALSREEERLLRRYRALTGPERILLLDLFEQRIPAPLNGSRELRQRKPASP